MGDNTERLFRGLLALDSIILKAVQSTPHTRALQVEARLYQTLAVVFARRARAAVLAAGAEWLRGPGVEPVLKATDAAFAGMGEEVAPLLRVATEEGWLVGREGALAQAKARAPKPTQKAKKPAQGKAQAHEIKPNFNLQDNEAIAALTNHQVFWVGSYYSKALSGEIADVASNVLLTHGLSAEEGAKSLASRLTSVFGYDPKVPKGKPGALGIPAGWKGSPDSYFRGLAANTATVARTVGAVREYTALGVTHYTVVNPKDERTCARCKGMAGREFETKEAKALTDKVVAATRPEEVKRLQPWLSEKEYANLVKVGGKDSTKLLAANGYLVPPFHYKCRCALDISDNAELNFDNLPEDEGAAAQDPLPSWNKPPKDAAQLDKRLRELAKAQFGATLTSHAGVTLDSPDVGPGASAHRDWYGHIHFARGRYSDEVRKLLASADGRELGTAETDALEILIHEHFHGLGQHKKPKKPMNTGYNDFMRAYILSEHGRVLEEGAVEFSAVRVQKDWAKRLGYTTPKTDAGWARYRERVSTPSSLTPSKLRSYHSYDAEVATVEVLCQAAGGDPFLPGAPLSDKAGKALNGLLHEWEPLKRPQMIAEAISEAHPGNGKGTVKAMRAYYVQQLIEKSMAKGKNHVVSNFVRNLETLLRPNNSTDLDNAWKHVERIL